MIIQVSVRPNSRQQKISKISEDTFEIWLKSKPERGKANKELLKLLADHFGVSQNQVLIVQGVKSKNKVIEIRE
jgi:uncharacterized protein (TIGR00251 family)